MPDGGLREGREVRQMSVEEEDRNFYFGAGLIHAKLLLKAAGPVKREAQLLLLTCSPLLPREGNGGGFVPCLTAEGQNVNMNAGNDLVSGLELSVGHALPRRHILPRC